MRILTNDEIGYWPEGIGKLIAEFPEILSVSTMPLEIIRVRAKDVIKNTVTKTAVNLVKTPTAPFLPNIEPPLLPAIDVPKAPPKPEPSSA